MASRSKVVQPKPINAVAIYCRVSTSDQDCTRQERDLRAFAQRAGYEVQEKHVFKETGSGADASRALRKHLLSLARAREVDAILVTELSRWGRSLQDLLQTLEELQSFGVSLITQTGVQFDLTSSHGKMMAGILGSLAEFERDLLRERIMSGLANAKARGKKIGRQPGAVIRPHPLTKQILQMHKAEVPVRKIASQLNVSPTTVQKAITKAKS